MEKINISKEPGFIYDLIFVFVLRFNKEYCLSKNINYNKTSEDTEYFNKIYLEHANISDELLPFFYLKNEDKCLISQFYYDDYVNSFENDYGFSTFYKALSKKEKLKENLIKFYFPETMLEISEQQNSTEYICKYIRNSKYSDMLKCALYSFFIETEYTINKLLEEFLSVYESMKRKYENELEALVKFESNFKMELIENYYNNVEMLDIKKYKSILVVPCLYCKNNINFSKTTFDIFGIDILSFVKKAIDTCFYITGSYNEKFIFGKRAYKKYDFWHDYIIYGYDDENNCFYSAGFMEDGNYKTFKISYDIFLISINEHDMKNIPFNLYKFNSFSYISSK